MKVTVCDICGKPAETNRNTKITLRYEFNGRVSESRPLDLCESCIVNLAHIAKEER